MDASDFNYQWIRNNGHVADAAQWLKGILEYERVEQLTDEQAYLLGLHINQQVKRAKTQAEQKQQFYPVERLTADGLERCIGDGSISSEDEKVAAQVLLSNVVPLDKFRGKRNG